MTLEDTAEEYVLSLFETHPEIFVRGNGIGVIRHPESGSLLVVIGVENQPKNFCVYRLPFSVFEQLAAQFQQSSNP